MSYLRKAAVAIDETTRQEILQKCSKLSVWIYNLEDSRHHRLVETSDMDYHIYMWDWEEPDEEMYKEFLRVTECRKHSILEISEGGNIWSAIETCDMYGCDEEFSEILGWTADIVLWNDSSDSLFEGINGRPGKWIEDEYGYFHCSDCGFEYDEPELKSPFCPHCGKQLD